MHGQASQKATAFAGVGFTALFLTTFLIGGETPDEKASADKVIAYYHDNATQLRVGAFGLVIAAVLLLVFVAGLREALSNGTDRRVSRHFATVAFGGGVAYALGTSVFAVTGTALVHAADTGDRSAAVALNLLDNSVFFPVMLGLAATLLGAGIAGLRSTSLPRWLAWAAVVLGVLAPAGPGGFVAFAAFPFWVLIAAISIARDSKTVTEVEVLQPASV